MHFTVVTQGSEGDNRPVIAICHGLMKAGHTLDLLADPSAEELAKQYNVPFRALESDIKQTMGPQGQLADLMNAGKVNQAGSAVVQMVNKHSESWVRDIAAAAKNSDAIICSSLARYVGLAVAQFYGVPAISLNLWPISPTKSFASPIVAQWSIPSWMNRYSHLMLNQVTWQLFKKGINQARNTVFHQPPRTQMWDDDLILCGVSPTLIQRPNDWQPLWQMSGVWTISSQKNWQASPALLDFLAAGEPPIYVGFGSMAGVKPLLHKVIAAIGTRRALFYPGWSGVETANLPSNIFVIDETPHDWLFPQVAMVIHHGGAGTTHTASKAGVPSVIIPFVADQYFWAKQLNSLGCAPVTKSYQKVTQADIEKMIEFAFDPSTKAKARQIGQQMQQEPDGVTHTVAQIEQFVQSTSRISH